MPTSEPTKKEIANLIQAMLLDKVDGLYFAGGGWLEDLMRGNKSSLATAGWGISMLVEKLEKAEDRIAVLEAELKASITQ